MAFPEAQEAPGLPIEVLAYQRRIEDLTLTLHEVQARLERKHLALLQCRASGRSLSFAGGPLPRHGSMRVNLVAIQDKRPHRHVEFQARALALPSRTLPSLRWRLLCHFGHPGLAIFRDPDAGSALSAWCRSGTEGGAEFMTLMPSEPASRSALRSLGTTDWAVVDRLLTVTRDALRAARSELELDPSWEGVASALTAQCSALDDGLRFDQREIQRRPGASPATVLRLTQVRYGGRHLGEVRLQFEGDGGLRWLLEDDFPQVPLACWPLATDGALSPELPFPVGRRHEWRAKVRFLRALAPTERRMVAALLSAAAKAAGATPGAAEEAESQVVLDASRLRGLARLLLVFDDLSRWVNIGWSQPSP